MRWKRQAVGCFVGEEIIVVSEVLEVPESTDFGRNRTGEIVMGHIQLLQTYHLRNGFRQSSSQSIEAHVEHCQICKLSNIGIEATCELVIDQEDFMEGCTQIPKAKRDTTTEWIVGNNDNRSRGVTEVRRHDLGKSIIINKDSIQSFFKQFCGKLTFEFIETDIKVVEIREGKK